MNFIYTPASGTGEAFLGAAVIESEEWICAVVDEVKYTGDQPDVGHAMSYPTTETIAWSTEALTLPLLQKGSPFTGMGDTSGVQIFNPSPDSVLIEVTIVDQAGIAVMNELHTIAPWNSKTVYAMNTTLPPGFIGALGISVQGGSGEIVAISNNVNYDVLFDGSASFALVHRP
jgi:hypothetical protein